MQFCFPTIYWHFKIGKIDFSNLKDLCILTDEWDCLVKTSRSVDYDWNEFLSKIEPFISQLPFKKSINLKFEVPWMNVYEKGGYQEAHHHMSGNNILSYCYFSNLPENSGKFLFLNDQYRNYCYNGLIEYLNPDDHVVEWAPLNVEEGDLIVFPSFLIHQSTYHKSKEQRVTISGNVSLV